jgi:hypothetical protein
VLSLFASSLTPRVSRPARRPAPAATTRNATGHRRAKSLMSSRTALGSGPRTKSPAHENGRQPAGRDRRGPVRCRALGH